VEYRTLGRTGLRVSVLGIGTWQLSGPVTIDGRADGYPDVGRERAIRLIRSGGELGINLIDTAPVYGDGEGERRVGEAIRGCRDAWHVVTKFGLARGAGGEAVFTAVPEEIRSWLEGSLRRLATDYVDVYLVHQSRKVPEFERTVRALEDLKKSGMIRFAGISSDDVASLHELERIAPLEVVMFSNSLLRRPDRIYEVLKRQRAGALVHGVFEQGRLGGQYWASPPRFSAEDFRSHAANGSDFQRFSALRRAVDDALGMTMAQVALRYVLDLEQTHCVVVGSATVERYKELAEAATRTSLPSGVRTRIDRLAKSFASRQASSAKSG
jgi:aryl-alcohol dehydrogenase-like predicted oxidoreductase